jgi:hypothetical protein
VEIGWNIVSTALEVLQNQIKEYVICSKCEAEFFVSSTDSRSLQDYAKLDIGFTAMGLQVWCRRHAINVAHIDFEGQTLTADFRCIE